MLSNDMPQYLESVEDGPQQCTSIQELNHLTLVYSSPHMQLVIPASDCPWQLLPRYRPIQEPSNVPAHGGAKMSMYKKE